MKNVGTETVISFIIHKKIRYAAWVDYIFSTIWFIGSLKRYVFSSLKLVSCLRFIKLMFKNMHMGVGERKDLNGPFIDFYTHF